MSIKTKIQTNISPRTEKILEFRKTHTLEETGERFGITGERVRQIELNDRKRCVVHDRWYQKECHYCSELNKYRTFLKSLNYDSLMKEVGKEGKNIKRDFISVQHKLYLIEILVKNYHKSFLEIVLLFQRDRTTILYLYNKYLEKIIK